MGRTGSATEFHVILGRVGSFHLWVALGGVKKMDPRPTCATSTRFMLELN